MLVNDNPAEQKVFTEFFVSKGYNFLPVSDPRTILQQIKSRKPDVIIVDNSLKGISGASIVVALRKRGLKIPIFFTSMFITKQLIDSLKGCNISDFFSKPVELDKLERILSSILVSVKKPSPNGVYSTGMAVMPTSILIITENEDFIKNPSAFVPGDLFKKQKYRIITKSDWQGSIDELKKPANNIRLIIVDADNESKTQIMTRLLRIIVVKLKIPVYFVADKFSQRMKEYLIKIGFDNFIIRSESASDSLQTSVSSALAQKPDIKRMHILQQRRKIIKDLSTIKSVPPLPDIFLKVEKLAHDPNATSMDYSEVLELDPGISARLLRMSNSAHFSFTRKIKSVRDAVALMGLREILSLVRLACITGSLRTNPEVESAVKKIWEHSAYCAIAAQLIYEKTEISSLPGLEDDLFISGIIHDIGKVVLWKFFPDIVMSFMLNPDIGEYPTVQEEENFLGVSHSEVGNALSIHWNLPDFFRDVIFFHHSPMRRPDSDLVVIIHIADFVSMLAKSDAPEGIENRIDTDLLEKIGYTIEQFRQFASELTPVIRDKADRASQLLMG